jgi:hypothetical protein
MRIPRVQEWDAAGTADDGVGFIAFRRIPVHWWLLDRWLSIGHPHWGWWYSAWSKLIPNWGDPFCAAYITVWWRFYVSRHQDEATVDLGWEGLPESVRAGILARSTEDRADRHRPDGTDLAPR